MAAETAELFSMCETLDGKPGFSDVDRTSIRCVYMWAVGHQEDNLAELIKKKFKLTEKAYVFSLFFLDEVFYFETNFGCLYINSARLIMMRCSILVVVMHHKSFDKSLKQFHSICPIIRLLIAKLKILHKNRKQYFL